jgi:CBS domain containing-hemolysin-like protein
MAVLTDLLRIRDPELASTLVLTPFLFIFGEILPKDTFRMRAETIVYNWSGPLRFACVALRPLALLFRWFGRLTRALPRARTTPDAMLGRERLGQLVHEVAEEGVLTPEQSRMVRNVMRVSSLPVRDAMVPVDAVDAVDVGFDRAELLRVSARNAHSRLPLRDGDFVGVVHVLDLVFSPETPLAGLVREAPRIPAEETVEMALHSLRRGRHTMGFVTGDGGRTLGIVTVKDLVEEVSGELPAF